MIHIEEPSGTRVFTIPIRVLLKDTYVVNLINEYLFLEG